ncbi:MAG TPA: CDP-alcohol phosphatidyltransferase family protein [Allosphingosinicella sp.]|nr:CDP-alcohol phosphatidyltransferase family protein [Allosphingosinicella sp.]
MADGAAAGTEAKPKKTRPPELEDGLNLHVFHPISHRLALALRRTPVSPNMVSVASGLSIVAAAASYTLLPYPHNVAAGLAFHLLWHILDGADGDLARLTGRTSPLGEVIDGICDYSGHVVLYTALAFHAGGWCWMAAPLAAASRILQANHIESVRRTYLWRAYGVPWIANTRNSVAQRGIVAGLTAAYVRLGAWLNPQSGEADARVEAGGAAAQELSRRIGRRALFLQEWLGPNRRTLLLALSMAVGTPLWFFLIEATLLNLLLIASVRRQRRVNADLAAALS